MDVEAPRGLLRFFEELEDPRMNRTKLHSLSDILVITICAVICGAERTVGDDTSIERRYYISDLDGQDAKAMLGYVRGHWGIENKLHWSLDVTFREDGLRQRKGHSAENLSRIRRLALNLLRQDKSVKVGAKAKRLKACLEEEYLLQILCRAF